jgi:hypothetical protein
MIRLTIIFLLLGEIILDNCAAFGQQTVIGRVVDNQSKKPIQGAKVMVVGIDTSATTNSMGYFQLVVDSTNMLLIASEKYVPVEVKAPVPSTFQVGLLKDEFPSYQGGFNAFYQHLSKTIRYPETALHSHMQGLVYAYFEIDSLGKMQNIRMLTDIGDYFGKEVIRALRKTPPGWIPVKSTSTFILPVIYQLEKTNQPSYEVETDLPLGKVLNEIVITGKARSVYFTPRRQY